MSDNVATATPDDTPKPLPKRVWLNFLLLAVLWIGMVLWSWWFTDLRVESLVGAVGGLGLLVVPLWLLDKLPRLAAGFESVLRRAVETAFASRWATAVFAVLLAAALGASLSTGTLLLKSELDEGVQVKLLRGDETVNAYLPAGATVRQPLWTGFASWADVTVQVECFTPTSVTLHPWSRPSLRIPGGMAQTGLLLLPSADLSDFAAPPMKWEIRLPDEGEPRWRAFDGHPLWVGLGAGCPVPPADYARFADKPRMRSRLDAPRGLGGEPVQLDPDDEVRVTVHMNGIPLVERTVSIEGEGIQTEVLDV